MPADRSRWFVSTQWLDSHLSAPDVVVVDASWYLPTQTRDGKAEYLVAHIPGAVHFDIDAIADKASGLPHMLPTPEAFASAVRKLGIGDGMKIVVYDGAGLFSAPRVWWTFKAMGARDVVLLDGGLPRWKAEGRAVEAGPVDRRERHFTARLDHAMVRNTADVGKALATKSATVVDARPADRFRGDAPEPRPGLRAGHMPGARNVPFSAVVADGRLLDGDELGAVFAHAGVDPTEPIITSCGSGVSAAILWLALETLGANRLGLYDGSWAEWGGQANTDVVTGPAD
jgi:thiosulfate/3-mercaptopyruvate sulfurtransferase